MSPLNDLLTLIATLLCGVLLGIIASALLLARRATAHRDRASLLGAENQQLREQFGDSESTVDRYRTELGKVERELATLRERVRSREEELSNRESLLADLRRQLPESFKAIGMETLEQSSEHFMKMATKALEPLITDSKGDLERRQQAIESLVKPVREELQKARIGIADLEKQRQGAYLLLDQRVTDLIEAQKNGSRETARLVTALRKPGVRGRWGEMQLRNVVERAGMNERCDFEEQVSTNNENGVARPDLVVQLPGKGSVVVDSKVALDAYLDATEAEENADTHLRRHATQVENHVKGLSKKEYWRQFERTPKVVVMFLPIESALTAALRVKPDLLERAMEKRVLIATPTTLLALLLSVAHGWQEEALAENARRIGEAGKVLHDRLGTLVDHFQRVGKHLGQTVNAYNKTIGSFDTRVIPGARRLEELGASTGEPIDAPSEVDGSVRRVSPRTEETPEDREPEEPGLGAA